MQTTQLANSSLIAFLLAQRLVWVREDSQILSTLILEFGLCKWQSCKGALDWPMSQPGSRSQ